MVPIWRGVGLHTTLQPGWTLSPTYLPQQYAVLSAASPQLPPSPIERSVSDPPTRVGVVRKGMEGAAPALPLAFEPQQKTAPSALSAHRVHVALSEIARN